MIFYSGAARHAVVTSPAEMLHLVLLLASAGASAPAAPAPSPTARPAPTLGRASVVARPKSLSDHASEMKAKGEAPRAVSFDDVSTGEPAPVSPVAADPPAATRGRAAGAPASDGGEKAAADAQRRMDRAVEKGLSVPERTRSSARDRARREWDEAAEACRRTPGCLPRYRDDPAFGGNKPLKTDQELIDDVRKRGFSEPHPTPR